MLGHQSPWEQEVGEITKTKSLALCGINPHDDNSQLRLLDFGCGNGRYLEVFAKYLTKQNLYGSEILMERVNEVREKGFNCIYLKTGDQLPFEDEYFNIVFSTNVIEHIPLEYYYYYINEFYRLLRKRGRFVIGTPNYPTKRFYDLLKAFQTGMFKYYFWDDPTHCNKLSIKKLDADLKMYFDEVFLEPSYILLEERIKLLRKPKIRNMLRCFGDKIDGYCIKI